MTTNGGDQMRFKNEDENEDNKNHKHQPKRTDSQIKNSNEMQVEQTFRILFQFLMMGNHNKMD